MYQSYLKPQINLAIYNVKLNSDKHLLRQHTIHRKEVLSTGKNFINALICGFAWAPQPYRLITPISLLIEDVMSDVIWLNPPNQDVCHSLNDTPWGPWPHFWFWVNIAARGLLASGPSEARRLALLLSTWIWNVRAPFFRWRSPRLLLLLTTLLWLSHSSPFRWASMPAVRLASKDSNGLGLRRCL